MVDLSLRFCSEQKNDRPAIWATTRLAGLKTIEPNFLIILDAIFVFRWSSLAARHTS
jgi:hypothetical protein